MPFARPSLAELIDRTAADIEAGLPGTDARLRRSNLAVLARAHAGAVHGLYGYLQWMADQLIIDTAETAYLERFAAIWGLLRLAAEFAQGSVGLTGAEGAVVPQGTALQRADGAAYTTTADATIAAGVATAAVAAVVAGAAGNALAGTALSLTLPVAGINSGAVVTGLGLTQGTDSEDDDGLRARLLARLRQPPAGGAKNDYVSWALQVPGVTRAWCYPLEDGAGTVKVRFVRDGDPSLIPDSTEVAAVQSYINEVRPVCAQVTVAAPTAAPLALTIGLTPNTQAVRDAVTAELADVLLREGSPGGTVLLSHLREAVSVAAGEVNHVMTVPSADVTHAAGYIPVLGTITWA